jgi:hypothetical protein
MMTPAVPIIGFPTLWLPNHIRGGQGTARPAIESAEVESGQIFFLPNPTVFLQTP